MIDDKVLLFFSEKEADTYKRQTEYGYFELPEADDLLDVYSCHSEEHVLEVIRQSRSLYHELLPLLEQLAPGIDDIQMEESLLVAAKLHDISMGGSRKEIALLDAADSLQEWLRSDQLKSARELRRRSVQLKRLAEDTRMVQGRYEKILPFLSMERLERNSCECLEDTLAAYHDEIKTYIRKHHAPSGGRWIFNHAAEILERYGTELDLKIVVLLVCLHSTSSTAVDAISCAGDDNEEKTREVIREFMSPYLTRYEMEQIMETGYFRKVICLASVLRLADTRRQGKLIKTIDLKELTYRLCEDGTADLYRMMSWGPERITNRMAHSILLSECCTDFGEISVSQNKGRWTVKHDIRIHDAQNPEIRKLFGQWRLRSYAGEVDTGALAESRKIHHVFQIGLKGITDRRMAADLESEWIQNWKNGDRMQCRYAESIKVSVMP